MHILPLKFFWKFEWNSTLLMTSSTKKYILNLILRISNFTQNLILLKSSLKNSGILLKSFKIGVFCCIVCKLRVNAYFPPQSKLILIHTTTEKWKPHTHTVKEVKKKKGKTWWKVRKILENGGCVLGYEIEMSVYGIFKRWRGVYVWERKKKRQFCLWMGEWRNESVTENDWKKMEGKKKWKIIGLLIVGFIHA